MKLARLAVIFAIIFGTNTLLLAQTAPNIENGFKSLGSYHGSDIDTVNLQNGNLMFHAPLFSYPQRGGKISLSYAFKNSSKNWQVEQYQDTQRNTHSKWVLAAPAAVYIGANVNMSVQRTRIVTTDTGGNQTTTLDGYSVTTPDQAVHWFPENLANNNMVTVDHSGFQYTLTASSAPDRSMDTAVVTDRQGSQYSFPHISHLGTPPNNNATPTGWPFTDQRSFDGFNTVNTFSDSGAAVSVTDANGNIFSAINNEGIFGPYYPILGSLSSGPVPSSTIPFPVGTPTATSDYSGCVTTHTISQAMILPFPGPDGRTSNVKVCASTFIPTASFSQPNVDPPNPNPPDSSYISAGYNYIVSAVMPDGNYWSFDYDGFGNITSVHLPTGGTITYQWQEISLPACDANITHVSRAVSSRTVNDLVNPPQTWQYTWGTLQNGSLTNYVLDPNGNETAHVFTAPVSTANCELYETETRYYQGTHSAGTLLKTVDTHYIGTMDDVGQPGNTLLDFAGHVVADTVTTTLPTGQISQIVRQYDNYPNPTTFGEVTDEKVYDYGSSPHGGLLREMVTTYQWQVNSAYLNAGFIDLPASVVIKDGSGCSMAETDYTYDEPAYLTTYTGTLPAGTHGPAPGGTVRGNLTTVTKWAAPTSSCNPKSGTAIASHTNWYDTGEVYQQIDPLGHTTTYSYDPVYAGAFVTQTCAPSTSGVSHCVSGTYDSATGLLESLTNENATTQASGNTPGDSAHTSNYGYDTSWRLIQAQAPPDLANSSARATTTFTPSTPNVFPLSVQHQRSVTTALTDTSTAYFDGVDRVNETTHALPNGTATVITTYDGVGQATSVTNPYFTTSDPTYGITYSHYDGLGRVTQTTKQDGSTSSVTYDLTSSAGLFADCTTAMDEAGKQRKTCADALGRLVEVDEPNPAAPATPAQGTLSISGSLQSHTSSGTAAVPASGSVSILSGDGSGADMHVDDPSEPCPPLPQSCPQIYDSGWVQVTINGIAARVNYGRFDTWTSVATNLASAINSSGANVYVTASANSTIISLQAKTAGAAGNGISLSTNSASNDPGDFGGGSFSGNPSGATLTNGADAVNPVTTYDQGTVTLTIGSFTASAPYSQSGNSTAAQIATALVGTGSTGLNRAGSPVSATANGANITITYGTAGAAGNGVVVAGSSQSTQTQWTFSPPSFTSAGTSLANGLNAGDVNNNPLVTLYQYDGLGNLTCVEQHGGVTGTGCSSSPTNDATSPWRVRRFTYDSVGRLLTAKNPESGTISYTYDNDGNLLQKTSPAPNQTNPAVTQTVSYCYDELHRVTGRAYGALSCPLASPVVSYAYDSGTNAKGKLVSMTDQAGTATYSYDILGRLSTETRSLIGANNALIPKTLSYEYNLDGSLYKLHYPSGAVVTYTPDSAGRITQAVDSGNGINYVTGATYDATSALTGFINGSGGPASITNTFVYNNRLQVCRMAASSAGAVPTSCMNSWGNILDLSYDFHSGNGDNGNVYGITNYRDQSRNQTFTYDPLNRLLSAQNAGTNCAATTANGKTEYWGNNYSYDAWGNLIGKTITKCGAENLSLTALVNNQLSGYTYDAAGNMTHDLTSGLNYTFDQENRITGANGYTYTYDDDGNRVRKSNGNLAGNGTLYWYMTPGIVAETDLTGTTKSEYIFFGGERVARRDGVNGAGGVFYYFSDHLKTASVVTDSSGTVKTESDYYPWGGELQITANDSNHYKFTGKERDSESGLDYFGARYYSNGLGRFVSADWSPVPHPVPYADFKDPQTLNLFTYVRNLPTIKLDIDGHQEKRSAEEEAKEDEEFEKELREFNEFLRTTGQEEYVAADAKNKADDEKVKNGYDDVTGVCNVNPPTLKSGPSISAPNAPPKIPEYIVSPGGDVIIVPKGANAIGPTNTGKGFMITGGSGGNGLDPKVTGVRIMDPKPARGPHPAQDYGYVAYMNKEGQTVNPHTGRVISANDPMAHIPLSPPKTTTILPRP